MPPFDPDPKQLELLAIGLRIITLRALGDPDAAADAAQESLARALEAIHAGKLADPAQLGAFVRGIARHVIMDVHRARARLEPLDSRPESAAPASPDSDPLLAIVSAEERARLRTALAQLGDSDRALLRLAIVDDLSSAELARQLGEPPSRIRKRKSRALDRLRRAFFGTSDEASRSEPERDYSVGATPLPVRAEET